jgi:hypothetical protein
MPIEVRELHIRVHVNNPPAATHEGKPAEFGLQDKTGKLTPGKLTADGALVFECMLKVSEADKPNFTGPYAQGTPKERFVYLSYRPVGGKAWIKRIKVMLGSITAEQVAKGKTLETTVDGRRAARVDAVWK